jgi:hypothetical protein
MLQAGVIVSDYATLMVEIVKESKLCQRPLNTGSESNLQGYLQLARDSTSSRNNAEIRGIDG